MNGVTNMPCNLAVSITKAAVLPEYLASLLTPEVVEQVVMAYLKQHQTYKTYQPIRSRIAGESVIFHLSSLAYRITITGGNVVINFPRYALQEADILAEELTTLLAKGAAKLFADQLQATLRK